MTRRDFVLRINEKSNIRGKWSLQNTRNKHEKVDTLFKKDNEADGIIKASAFLR